MKTWQLSLITVAAITLGCGGLILLNPEKPQWFLGAGPGEPDWVILGCSTSKQAVPVEECGAIPFGAQQYLDRYHCTELESEAPNGLLFECDRARRYPGYPNFEQTAM